MRILYGAFAQGQGHFSKAAVLVPILERFGHEVRVISSGGQQPPAGYHFTWHRHFPALSYVVSNGQTSYRKTVGKWLREIPTVFRHLGKIRAIVREFEPELIITDFEPLTASPVLNPPCEVIALSRQAALLDPDVPLPEEMAYERKLTRSMFRLFTAGADRLHGYHYEPATFSCVPPVVREEIARCTPHDGEHVLVYNHYQTTESGSVERLIDWARDRKQPVRAYGYPDVPRGRQGLVEFKPPHRTGMLDDMASSRAVIATAGLTTGLEAFLLRKPCCVVPIPGQWEQIVNAAHLQQAGIAAWSDTWDYDRLLDLPAPNPDHPLHAWLHTPPERVLDHVMGGRLGIEAEAVEPLAVAA